MKKTLVAILLFIPIVVSSLLGGLVFRVQNNVANAESLEVLQTLINPNLTPEEMVASYNVSSVEISNFTPFDNVTKSRMSGQSIAPTVYEHNQILLAEYNLLDNGGLSTSQNLSLGMWLYFSDISVHSLTIKLKIDDSNYYKIELTKQQLIDILKKTDNLTEQAFSWNYIEIPLSSNMIIGEVSTSGELKEFSSVEISYTSAEISENSKFAAIRLYGMYLQKSSVTQVQATQKQQYNIFSFKYWDNDTLSSIVQGDTLSILNKNEAVEYAWVGDVNLCDDSNNVKWDVKIKFPTNKSYEYRFGSNVTFAEMGEYIITYRAQIINPTTKDVLVEIYENKSFIVRPDNLIFFDFNNYEILEGESINLSLQSDNTLDLSSYEIVSLEANLDNVKITPSSSGLSWHVEALSEGQTDLVVKIKAKRHNNSEVREYTASTKLIVYKNSEANNLATYILLGALGVILAISLAFGIKTVVKDRKNDVK